ncbi:UNVERIFIED_CONTAM: hypothetical protein GTU68_043629, partial [Idotea baltica]|nr:hypothetical protein [Idotea baltica]
LIAGLGNPGSKYEFTRHNIGFLALDRFTEKTLELNSLSSWNNKFDSAFIKSEYSKSDLLLCKPETYMNESGKAISKFINFYKADSTFIILHDDVDLPFGKLRIRKGGSPAGHNGLKSIIECTGNNNFIKIKIGVGRPERGEVRNWVLREFSSEERVSLDPILDQASDCLKSLLEDGLLKAQNKYNQD